MHTRIQLIEIISQAMWIGNAYASSKKRENFDEKEFKTYARGMIKVLLESTCLEDDYVLEESIEEFLRKFRI
tara:strand:- start:996 stop:1211 length:216 start_codon:yes stop_codon:yes gene_type:complete